MDWEDEEPLTEEDAIKRALKRADRLNNKPGLVKDLWQLHQNCHKEVYENGNMEHLPMNFIRYEGTSKEDPQELFYICKKCISEYIMTHPEVVEKDKIVILRGKLTKECNEFLEKKAQEQYNKEAKKEIEDQKKIDKVWNSKKPCPVCGKPLKDHDKDSKNKCLKEFYQENLPDENGGTNKP